MVAIRILGLLLCLLCTACQLGYLARNGYGQMEILIKRVPVEKALKDPNLPETHKQKLKLVQEARTFAETSLNLKATSNYTAYVELDRPYVSYIVQAAKHDKLVNYLWNFPLIGKVPYKGYFSEKEAKAEAAEFDRNRWDTAVRGVSAYSTLGWFHDPILSSMMNYSDDQLVNTIIHETVHATVYLKSAADFNERLATYLGDRGTELYFINKEGLSSPTVAKIRRENEDSHLFSKWLSTELKALEEWYETHKDFSNEEKKKRLDELKLKFTQELKPKLASTAYDYFPKLELNNAVLLGLKTYYFDLQDFAKLEKILGGDFKSLLKYCKNLKSSPNPEQTLKDFIAKSSSEH